MQLSLCTADIIFCLVAFMVFMRTGPYCQMVLTNSPSTEGASQKLILEDKVKFKLYNQSLLSAILIIPGTGVHNRAGLHFLDEDSPKSNML